LRYYWCNIVVVERICNDYWHSIRRLFVFYDLPITIFSTIFADNNPHCLKLRDMSLESSELYASLLRHFAGRNRWVKQHLFYNNLLNIRQFFCATFYAIFYANFDIFFYTTGINFYLFLGEIRMAWGLLTLFLPYRKTRLCFSPPSRRFRLAISHLYPRPTLRLTPLNTSRESSSNLYMFRSSSCIFMFPFMLKLNSSLFSC